MKKHLTASIALSLLAACAFAGLPEKIVCEGDYGGHLQGVATDGDNIYWSFTVAVVKTDLSGKILASRAAPSHQGDMCFKDGVVYVAVNRGLFNTETGGVSQVTAYDAKTLEPIKTTPLPDMPHGAGGMTWKDDRFYIIGGLPLKHERNYVYEYTRDFTFVKRHELDTGFTWMGIQTAAYEDDTFYFGIYGTKGDPAGVLACPGDLSTSTRYIGGGSVGIVKLDGAYYLGGTAMDKTTNRHNGWLVRQGAFPAKKNGYLLSRTGKGQLRLFFDGRDASGWKDAGYVFNNNGNSPVFSQNAPFVPVRAAAKCKEFQAVGISEDRAFWIPDLVRGIHRAAQHDEVFSLHVPGTPKSLKNSPALATAVATLQREAEILGVTVVGR